MKPLSYARPESLADAQKHVAAGAVPKLGGIDLLGRMKRGSYAPDTLVDLTRLPELAGLQLTGSSWRIGARCSIAELADAELPPQMLGLREAALGAATPQIRNQATVVGNLLQAPRCWYLHDGDIQTMHPGKEAELARQGRNENHAIFGNQQSVFVQASNLAPALLALDAELEIAGQDAPAGRLALSKLWSLPTNAKDFGQRLAPGSIVSAIHIKAPQEGAGLAHVEFRQKESYDWAMASAAALIEIEHGRVRSCRAVLGSVAPIPWLARKTAEILQGKALSDELIKQALDADFAAAKPLSEGSYKLAMARHCLHKALKKAAKRAMEAK